MQRKISKHHPLTKFSCSNDRDFYIADYTRRTSGARSVEIHVAEPLTPNGSAVMDCLHLSNPRQLSVEFAVFDDNEFKDSQGNNIEHCECCLYPLPANGKKWIAFVELKDCDDGNVINYKTKIVRQIFDACAAFRGFGIPCKNAYGLISCPRHKVGFNDSLFYSQLELIKLKRMLSIDFIVTNNGIIVDDAIIRPKL